MTKLMAKPLMMTGHPVQRCGAWAVTLLADREHPDEVSVDDLESVAGQLVDDVVRAAIAAKDSEFYDWWKVLFALYPNSKATHSGRPKDADALRPEIADLFAADPMPARMRPCTFCGSSSGMLWTKKNLPLFDTDRAVNTLPPQSAGWPVCRACRIAMWALPYGARVTAGSATVLTCEDPYVEWKFAQRNVARAARIRQLGFSGLGADASPEYVALKVLSDPAVHRLVGTTLWMFKNDNQDPWLRVTGTRVAVAGFLRRMQADPQAWKGWLHLRRVLTRRDTRGVVVQHGADAAAKTLFEGESQRSDGLLRTLLSRAERTDQVSQRALLAWGALFRLYVKEMYEMDSSGLKPVVNVLAEWITAEKNASRGRFGEYQSIASDPYKLNGLLMKATARLVLDGRRPADVTEAAPVLLASGSQGWRLRGQLFFEVVAVLMERDVQIGKKTETDDEEIPEMTIPPNVDEEEDYA
ncbi:MAG: hypothetical protein ACRDTF_22085 [Pseudonocardiaceae bacterium]